MKITCDVERYIDALRKIDEAYNNQYDDKSDKQDLKLHFHSVFESKFHDCINQYIDEGNEYSPEKVEMVKYILKYLKDNT